MCHQLGFFAGSSLYKRSMTGRWSRRDQLSREATLKDDFLPFVSHILRKSQRACM